MFIPALAQLFLNKLIFSLTADRPAHLRLLPGPISALQLLFAVCFCSALQLSGVLTFQKVTVQQVKMYAVYAVLFVGSVYASMKSLEGSNVETQIVFRSATPLTVCVLDALWLGRELPNAKSLAALAAVAAGAVLYVATDAVRAGCPCLAHTRLLLRPPSREMISIYHFKSHSLRAYLFVLLSLFVCSRMLTRPLS
jgi:drug/metabolite transporter (DMT)-like permease